MRRPLLLVAAIAVVLALAAGAVAIGSDGDVRDAVEPRAYATESGQARTFELERVATGFNRPTWVGAAPGDPEALWVLEQPGRLVRLRGDRRETRIDIGDRVLVGAEQGLLGVAFHPDFAKNRRLFLHWS